MKEIITLSRREMQRMQVLEQVVRKTVSLKGGAALMKVSYRQAKRLLARYRREGPKGLAHRHRGRSAPNARGQDVRQRVLTLHREVCGQFNDSHFVQMLEEREGLRIGRETVRRWLREAGIRPKRRRRPPRHRSRRARRPQIGLLVQWDGSPHHWFGPERPACSLLHATDDATGTVLGALFRPQEDAIGYLQLVDMVLRCHGIPAAIYPVPIAGATPAAVSWFASPSTARGASGSKECVSPATPQRRCASRSAAGGLIKAARITAPDISSRSITKPRPPLIPRGHLCWAVKGTF